MKIIGVMSGTSLDGVDIALCDVGEGKGEILAATTVPYDGEWKKRLSTLEDASAYEYALAHVELGHHIGKLVKRFMAGRAETVEAIASHGHTIFHRPELGLTAQIGDGDAIAAETGMPVVSNFRTLDVALGGQGAPLVPIGDELLFPQYEACLNLGGIANISYRSDGVRVAYDICPCNMALNRLAAMLGYPYDEGGMNARGGVVQTGLLHDLDALGYYAEEGPKSLGKEWFVGQFWPLVKRYTGVVPTLGKARDALATVTAHIAMQTGRVLEAHRIGTLLVTGGGAWNSYLVEQIGNYRAETRIVVPDKLLVDFKEALVFAFLGYLRLTGKTNTLRSVTGAKRDSIGGVVSGR